MAFSYSKDNGIVRISHYNFKDSDSIVLVNNGFSQFIGRVELKLDGKPLLDEDNKVIYVLHKDFRPNYNLIYLVEGDTYKVKTSFSNSYGLLEKEGKPNTNKRLAKKINIIKQDWGNYTVRIYQGIEAYQKFGYNTILGVIEINKKK